MTSQDTADGKIQALERAMLAECLKGILGTCGSETARRSALQRRQTDLIEPDKKDKGGNGDLLQNHFQTTSLFFSLCHGLHGLLFSLISGNFPGIRNILSITGIQSVNHLTHSGIDILIRKDLLGRIHEKKVYPTLYRQQMLLPAPTLTNAALQKIAFHRTLEHLLRDRHHDPIEAGLRSCKAQIAQARNIAVLTFGKKPRDACLAAQSFFLRKRIRTLAVHDYLDR